MEFMNVAVLGVMFVTGLLPKLGPGRALVLALRSKLRPRRLPVSNRLADVDELHTSIHHMGHQGYIVVTGLKGVGKSTIVQTAMNRQYGVIEKPVEPDMTCDEIINSVLKDVANRRFDFRGTASRVVWFYSWFPMRSPLPIAILTVDSGPPNSSLSNAVRTLRERHGIRVIVDGQRDTLHSALFNTYRESVIEIEPMEWETLQQMDQLKPLFQVARSVSLDRVVWTVLGGFPRPYERLAHSLDTNKIKTIDDQTRVIGDFLCDEVMRAIELIIEAKLTDQNMKSILKLIEQDRLKEISHETIARHNLKPPSDTKLLYLVRKEEERKTVYVPVNGAIGLALRHRWYTLPRPQQLIETVQKELI